MSIEQIILTVIGLFTTGGWIAGFAAYRKMLIDQAALAETIRQNKIKEEEAAISNDARIAKDYLDLARASGSDVKSRDIEMREMRISLNALEDKVEGLLRDKKRLEEEGIIKDQKIMELTARVRTLEEALRTAGKSIPNGEHIE
jgi:predicted RNase H-like nuclease (RuvC/YqgF family)